MVQVRSNDITRRRAVNICAKTPKIPKIHGAEQAFQSAPGVPYARKHTMPQPTITDHETISYPRLKVNLDPNATQMNVRVQTVRIPLQYSFPGLLSWPDLIWSHSSVPNRYSWSSKPLDAEEIMTWCSVSVFCLGEVKVGRVGCYGRDLSSGGSRRQSW